MISEVMNNIAQLKQCSAYQYMLPSSLLFPVRNRILKSFPVGDNLFLYHKRVVIATRNARSMITISYVPAQSKENCQCQSLYYDKYMITGKLWANSHFYMTFLVTEIKLIPYAGEKGKLIVFKSMYVLQLPCLTCNSSGMTFLVSMLENASLLRVLCNRICYPEETIIGIFRDQNFRYFFIEIS